MSGWLSPRIITRNPLNYPHKTWHHKTFLTSVFLNYMLATDSTSSYTIVPLKPSMPTSHHTTSLATRPFQGSTSPVRIFQVKDTYHYLRSHATQSFTNLLSPILTAVIQLPLCYTLEVKAEHSKNQNCHNSSQGTVLCFSKLNSTSFFTFIMVWFGVFFWKAEVKPLSNECGLASMVWLHNCMSISPKCFHCDQRQW